MLNEFTAKLSKNFHNTVAKPLQFSIFLAKISKIANIWGKKVLSRE